MMEMVFSNSKVTSSCMHFSKILPNIVSKYQNIRTSPPNQESAIVLLVKGSAVAMSMVMGILTCMCALLVTHPIRFLKNFHHPCECLRRISFCSMVLVTVSRHGSMCSHRMSMAIRRFLVQKCGCMRQVHASRQVYACRSMEE